MKDNGLLEQGGPVYERNQDLTIEGRPLGPMEPDTGAGQDYMSIMALWDILLKRRWTVVTVMVVLSTLVAISTFRTKPVYKAVARVQVEAESPLIQSFSDLAQYQQNWDMDTFLQTQIEIIKSDALAWRTIEEMRLAENPSFGPAKNGDSKQPSEQRKAELISGFKGGLGVQLMPKTHMLLVSYESTDPGLAARVPNALVADYIDYNFREKYDAIRQASGWMEEQLDELKAKVEKSQGALVDYERQHAITNTGDKQSVQDQMLSDLGKDLTTVQGERIQKESLYNQVLTNRAQMAVLLQDALLQKLEEKQADLKNQYADIVTQYGPNYPKALRIQQQMADVRDQIAQEQNRAIDRIRGDYVTAQNREKLAENAVSRQKDELGKLNQLQVEHNMLKRDFETNQQLYQNLLGKLKEATLSVGLRPNNIHLVDSATTPTSSVRPRKLLNITIGLLAGLMLGIVVAFAQEALDQSVKSLADLELLLGAQALAIIPYDHPAHGLTRKAGTAANLAVSRIGLVSVKRPHSVLAESYRSLRTAVLSISNPQPKTILVTSTKSGEGKTVTSVNLASVLAQRKGPVVLVDCDLRKPSVAAELKLSNDKGVTGIVAKGMSLDDALQVHPGLPALSVLTTGPKVGNPAELLSSDRMAELLHELAQRFEHVIIDSPPVLAVTDAAILAGMVDGVVLVVEGSKTHKGALVHSHRTLVSSGARILGAVFNKYDHRREGAYGYGTYFNYYPYAHYGKDS
jgi:succinoglycan biosynthesis transport protein ExoP